MVTANNDGLLPGEFLKKDVNISRFVFFTLLIRNVIELIGSHSTKRTAAIV
jgi:hypothetical protein